MSESIFNEAGTRMDKSIDSLHGELTKIRTGRANPGLLETVMVPYYGNDTHLNQVANINVADARTLVITPWEKAMLQPIEKAIRIADLGLNPVSVGESIRVPLPALTEERRRELIKLVRSVGENAKIAIRSVRRDANTQLKDLLKTKSISEDDERRAQDKVQQITDNHIKDIDRILAKKEADLMEV